MAKKKTKRDPDEAAAKKHAARVEKVDGERVRPGRFIDRPSSFEVARDGTVTIVP